MPAESQSPIKRETLGAGLLIYSALALVWYMQGYGHAVTFGVGAVFSIAVVALGIKRIERGGRFVGDDS